MRIIVEVSVGELIDRITILELKSERLAEEIRPFAVRELAAAREAWDRALVPCGRMAKLAEELRRVNRELWDLEEELRQCERFGSFDEQFVARSRAVYKANDRRAALKQAIDELSGGDLGDQKSYPLPSL